MVLPSAFLRILIQATRCALERLKKKKGTNKKDQLDFRLQLEVYASHWQNALFVGSHGVLRQMAVLLWSILSKKNVGISPRDSHRYNGNQSGGFEWSPCLFRNIFPPLTEIYLHSFHLIHYFSPLTIL